MSRLRGKAPLRELTRRQPAGGLEGGLSDGGERPAAGDGGCRTFFFSFLPVVSRGQFHMRPFKIHDARFNLKIERWKQT